MSLRCFPAAERSLLMTMIRKALLTLSSCRLSRARNSPRSDTKGRINFRRNPAEDAAYKIVKYAGNARKVSLDFFVVKLNVQVSTDSSHRSAS